MASAQSIEDDARNYSGEFPSFSSPSAPPIAVAVPVGDVIDARDVPRATVAPEPQPLPTSDEEARAFASAERERNIATVRNHCRDHLSQNPDSSFVTWIATLHPENAEVSIDPRFLIAGNPWRAAYEEARDDLFKGRGRSADNAVTATADAERPSPSAPGPLENPDRREDTVNDHDDRNRFGLIDTLVAVNLLVIAVCATLVFEILATYCYLSYWLCAKIVNALSPSNALKFLPRLMALFIGQIFRLLDALILLAGTLLVESIAWCNYLLTTILACSHERGRAAHQVTRRSPHHVRWAFRRWFEGWNPPRAMFGARFGTGSPSGDVK